MQIRVFDRQQDKKPIEQMKISIDIYTDDKRKEVITVFKNGTEKICTLHNYLTNTPITENDAIELMLNNNFVKGSLLSNLEINVVNLLK